MQDIDAITQDFLAKEGHVDDKDSDEEEEDEEENVDERLTLPEGLTSIHEQRKLCSSIENFEEALLSLNQLESFLSLEVSKRAKQTKIDSFLTPQIHFLICTSRCNEFTEIVKFCSS